MAGVLIEAELPFLLVGIGVNVRHKPEVPKQGPDRGRPAACLADFGVDSSDEVGGIEGRGLLVCVRIPSDCPAFLINALARPACPTQLKLLIAGRLDTDVRFGAELVKLHLGPPFWHGPTPNVRVV